MFRPRPPMTRVALAGIEGQKAKRLLGALRTLWRSSPWAGQDGKITHLKSCLLPSPEQLSRSGSQVEDAQDPEPEPADPRSDEQAAGSDGDDDSTSAADERVESRDEMVESADENVEPGDESVAGEPADDADASSDGESLSQPESQPEVAKEIPLSPASSDSRTAPTLQLGSPSSPESVGSDSKSESMDPMEHLPDSQVEGAGWMGRGMMYWRSVEKKEIEEEEKGLRISYLIDSIKYELCHRVCPSEVKKHWGEFKVVLEKKLQKSDLGHEVFMKLSDPDTFLQWHAAQMKKDL